MEPSWWRRSKIWTPRAFQSAKSSSRHKWGCDYASNHSDSRTVITTRRATLARWNQFYWRRRNSRAESREQTLHPKNTHHFHLPLQQCEIPAVVLGFSISMSLKSSRITAALMTSCIPYGCNAIQYNNTTECLKSSQRTEDIRMKDGGHSDPSACLWLHLSPFFL